MQMEDPTQGGADAGRRSANSTCGLTTAKAQHARILAALKRSPKTSYQLRKIGCYQAPTRIKELRRFGYDISTARVTIWDDEGYEHSGVALYTLHGKKEK